MILQTGLARTAAGGRSSSGRRSLPGPRPLPGLPRPRPPLQPLSDVRFLCTVTDAHIRLFCAPTVKSPGHLCEAGTEGGRLCYDFVPGAHRVLGHRETSSKVDQPINSGPYATEDEDSALCQLRKKKHVTKSNTYSPDTLPKRHTWNLLDWMAHLPDPAAKGTHSGQAGSHPDPTPLPRDLPQAAVFREV